MVWLLLEDKKCFGNKKTWTGPFFLSLQDGVLFVFRITSEEPKIVIQVQRDTFQIDPNIDVENSNKSSFTIIYNQNKEHKHNRNVVLVAGSTEEKDRWLAILSSIRETANESVQPNGEILSNTSEKVCVLKEGVLLCSPVYRNSKEIIDIIPYSQNENIFGEQATVAKTEDGHKKSKSMKVNNAWAVRYVKVLSNGCIQIYDTTSVCNIALSNVQIFKEADPAPDYIGTDSHIFAFTINVIPSVNLSSGLGKYRLQLGKLIKRDSIQSITFGSPLREFRDSIAQRIKKYSEWYRDEVHKERTMIIKSTQVVSKTWMYKKGPKAFSRWKKRYFVFLSNRELVYYENEMGGKVKGSIDLSDVDIKDIRIRSDVKDAPAAQIIEIITKRRSWLICPQNTSTENVYHWLELLKKKDEYYSIFKESCKNDGALVSTECPTLEGLDSEDIYYTESEVSEDEGSSSVTHDNEELDHLNDTLNTLGSKVSPQHLFKLSHDHLSDLRHDSMDMYTDGSDSELPCFPIAMRKPHSPFCETSFSEGNSTPSSPESKPCEPLQLPFDDKIDYSANLELDHLEMEDELNNHGVDNEKDYRFSNVPQIIQCTSPDLPTDRKNVGENPLAYSLDSKMGQPYNRNASSSDEPPNRPSMVSRSQSSAAQQKPNSTKVLGRSSWQLVSGNLPVECLSLSPYSAKVLAENLTGVPTPRRSIVNDTSFSFEQSTALTRPKSASTPNKHESRLAKAKQKIIVHASGKRGRSSLPSVISTLQALDVRGILSPKGDNKFGY